MRARSLLIPNTKIRVTMFYDNEFRNIVKEIQIKPLTNIGGLRISVDSTDISYVNVSTINTQTVIKNKFIDMFEGLQLTQDEIELFKNISLQNWLYRAIEERLTEELWSYVHCGITGKKAGKYRHKIITNKYRGGFR